VPNAWNLRGDLYALGGEHSGLFASAADLAEPMVKVHVGAILKA
jgi:hypothetical protein